MPNFAIVVDNIVENVIIADSKELAEEATGKPCFEYTEDNRAFIGYGYNPDTNTFDAPPPPENIDDISYRVVE